MAFEFNNRIEYGIYRQYCSSFLIIFDLGDGYFLTKCQPIIGQRVRPTPVPVRFRGPSVAVQAWRARCADNLIGTPGCIISVIFSWVAEDGGKIAAIH